MLVSFTPLHIVEMKAWIWQVMLTGEPSLVSMSAALLEAMLEHNSASLATLYQTGVFFFALAYCGSNLVEIGRLFKVGLCIYSFDLSDCLPCQGCSPTPGTVCCLYLHKHLLCCPKESRGLQVREF